MSLGSLVPWEAKAVSETGSDFVPFHHQFKVSTVETGSVLFINALGLDIL